MRRNPVWDTVDWSLQDVEISKQLGISRERVRQVRVATGAGRAVLHGQRTIPPKNRKNFRPETWFWTLKALCQVFAEIEQAESEISRILTLIVRVKVERKAWKNSPARTRMQNNLKLARYHEKHRAAGGLSKAEWMAKVTKPQEYHIQKTREYQRERSRRKFLSLGLAPWYKPEPRGRDGVIPRYTREVIRARRQEYIDWWKPIYQMRANEWKLEHWESMRRSGHRRLSNAIRKRLHKFVNKPILTPTCELIGCSVGELKAHLERQFRPGWSWNNYGKKWNIDHITPLAKFDLSQPAHVKLASHYTNLRPMAVWANSLKQDRMIKAAAQPFLPMASPVLMAA